MSKVIIYQAEDGTVAVCHPNLDCGLTMEQIAAKDVPAGKGYKIVDTSDLPPDSTFQGAWEADISSPDGTGADYGIGSTKSVTGWDEDGTPILRQEASCQ